MGIAYNTLIPSFNDLALLFDAANTRSYPGSGTSWFDVGTSGTAATMYINGSLFTTFTGLSANSNTAGDTKMFDFPGCDGALGLIWFKFGEADSETVVKRHYDAMKGRFGIT